MWVLNPNCERISFNIPATQRVNSFVCKSLNCGIVPTPWGLGIFLTSSFSAAESFL